MKEPIDFLMKFKAELAEWIDKPTVSAPVEVMNKMQAAVELAIELINANRKASLNERQMFEGGAYLARYFDGWGEVFHDKYLKMVEYVKENHMA